MAIVLSVPFQSTDYDYPFGSFKPSLISVRLHVYYIHWDVYHIALFDWQIYFQMINMKMISQLYHVENKLYFREMIMMSVVY